jgi:cytidylate kinase
MDEYSSRLSKDYRVRAEMMHWQHVIADKHDIVVEGRDAGSVVFPNADFKFYLTADSAVRAARWCRDQAGKGNVMQASECLDRVNERDKRDMEREHSPLIIPAGAVIIDNTDLSFDQVVDQMLAVVKSGSKRL